MKAPAKGPSGRRRPGGSGGGRGAHRDLKPDNFTHLWKSTKYIAPGCSIDRSLCGRIVTLFTESRHFADCPKCLEAEA